MINNTYEEYKKMPMYLTYDKMAFLHKYMVMDVEACAMDDAQELYDDLLNYHA